MNVWPTNLTSMRVAYGDSNVLRCSVQLAYDRFFVDFGYDDTHQVPINLPSNPSLNIGGRPTDNLNPRYSQDGNNALDNITLK